MNEIAVFVYGTLRRGGSNSFRMDSGDFVGMGKLHGRIYRIDTHPSFVYPALVCGGEEWVKGELYLVSEECLRELDAFEGVTPSGTGDYRRVNVVVAMEDGSVKHAWVWEWQAELGDAVFLEDGDWLNHEPNPS